MSTQNKNKNHDLTVHTNAALMKWFKVLVRDLLRGKNKVPVSKMRPGMLYVYEYDPKWKDILPVFDTLPIIILVDVYKDGFLGLNFHYLTKRQRMVLFRSLLKLQEKKINKRTQLIITWALVKSVAKSKYYEKTVHRYLFSHIKSHINEIEKENWSKMILLPLAEMHRKRKKRPGKRKRTN